MTRGSLKVFGLPLLAVLALGCASQNKAPLYASSADSPGYAVAYPQSLAATRGRMSEQQNKARQTMGEVKTFPGDLESPNWEETLKMVDQAEADGKSEAYAKRYEETNQISAFFEEEHQEIRNVVAGSVQYAAKQNSCNEGGKLGGAAVHAMDKAVEKQQEKRLRGKSEAHRTLERQKERFGKKNAELLGDQLDKISEASYLVNVGTESSRRDLEAQVAEASTAKRTLEAEIEELEAVSKDDSVPAADRKVADKMLEEARAALGQVDAEVQQAEPVVKEAAKTVEALRKEFSEVMEALRDELKNRQQAQAAAAPAK